MKKFILFLVFVITGTIWAQENPEKIQTDKFLPKGNSAYEEKDYSKAEAYYRKSNSKFPNKSQGAYNLGNSIYRTKQNSEAKFSYLNAIEQSKSRPEKHQAYHNLGNVLMNQKNYQAAVEAYKQALINDPKDEQTRYNYALARKMLKDNPPPPNKDDDKSKDKRDKDKEKDKDKKDDQQQKDDQDKNQDKKDGNQKQDQPEKQEQQQQKPQPKPGGISPQRMENILDALNNEEKKIQDKVKAREHKGKPVQTDKDW